MQRPSGGRALAARQFRAVERTAHGDRRACQVKPLRGGEYESMGAATEAGAFEISPMPVGERAADQPAIGENVEADRRFGVFDVLRPAPDPPRCDAVDVA